MADISESSTYLFYYCGGRRHPRRDMCPARDSKCNNRNEKGHWGKVCKNTEKGNFKQTAAAMYVATVNDSSSSSSVICDKSLEGKLIESLVDTGSSRSFITKSLVKHFNLLVLPASGSVSLAST